MKGLVFTEFLEMVESKWGLATVDRVIQGAALPNNGAYTSVGTYPHGEMIRLVIALEKESGIPFPVLLKSFGEALFGGLSKNYPHLIEGVDDCLSLLHHIEDIIHVEVKKLYPESNPPMFEGERLDKDTLKLRYTSHRSMADVAEGLIIGCSNHFGDQLSIDRLEANEEGTEVIFLIKRLSHG